VQLVDLGSDYVAVVAGHQLGIDSERRRRVAVSDLAWM
jgi:hypothetical protein